MTNFTDPAGLFGGPSFVPGTNYAVAGATASPTATNGTPAISLPNQVGAFSLHQGGAADPNALYVIMIGGNDVRDAALYDTGSAATDAITAGVGTELAEIKTLAGEGAKNFFVVNVPNVGVIPEFAQENPGDAANATAYSISYDSQLSGGLNGLGLPKGDQLVDFNLYALNTYILDNAASLGSRTRRTPASRTRPSARPAQLDVSPTARTRTSRVTCIGTISTRRQACRPCGPRVSERRFPSPRPGP